CQDHSVWLVDMKSGKQVHKWSSSAQSAQSIAWNPGGSNTWWGNSSPATQSIRFTPDNQAMMLLDNQSFIVFNPATGKESNRMEVRVLFTASPLILPDHTFAIMNVDDSHPAVFPLAGAKYGQTATAPK